MAVSVENTSTLGRKLKVSVPNSKIVERVNEKMTQLAKDAHLKGFRKGKVPLSVIKQKFGVSVRQEVINDLIRQTFSDAVKDKELQLAGLPSIEEVDTQQDDELSFTATFEVYPEIHLSDFSNFVIEKSQVQIQDQDVLNMVEKLRDQFANWFPVQRAIVSGDKITVDFERLFYQSDAKKEQQKNIQMVVGAEGVVPGLSEALIGRAKGELIELEVQYPKNWADNSAAGKQATLRVTIHEVTEKETLSLVDLADKLGIENQDLEKLNASVRERMQQELDQALKEEIQEKILEELLEKNPVELPKSLIAQEKEAMRRELSQQRRQNISVEALNNPEAENQAKKRVELGLLLNEVIKKFALKADGQRVREEINKIASRFSKPSEVMEAYYKNKDLLSGIERMVLLEQAVEAILKEAKIVEKIATFDEVMNPPAEEIVEEI